MGGHHISRQPREVRCPSCTKWTGCRYDDRADGCGRASAFDYASIDLGRGPADRVCICWYQSGLVHLGTDGHCGGVHHGRRRVGKRCGYVGVVDLHTPWGSTCTSLNKHPLSTASSLRPSLRAGDPTPLHEGNRLVGNGFRPVGSSPATLMLWPQHASIFLSELSQVQVDR
jgi:hypothetical protein